MEHLIEFGLFTGKLLIVLIFIGVLLALIAGFAAKMRGGGEIEFENLNEHIANLAKHLIPVAFEKKQAKKILKELGKTESAFPKEAPRLFILEFKGDVTASQVEQLRDEVTALLCIATPSDEVLIRVESPGGTVHGYGLAAAQLCRIKDAKLQLTASVDKVAASGGYLMAAVAHKIIAAPFAIVGSIGVVAQVPNVHRLLKKHNIDYEEITSGEFKRTISVFGEISEKGRRKFTDQIEETHQLFKDFVHHERPQVLMDQVATGEYWFGRPALNLKLVDQILTSDEYIFARRHTHRLLKLKILAKKSLTDKISEAMKAVLVAGGINSVLRKDFGSKLGDFDSGLGQSAKDLKF